MTQDETGSPTVTLFQWDPTLKSGFVTRHVTFVSRVEDRGGICGGEGRGEGYRVEYWVSPGSVTGKAGRVKDPGTLGRAWGRCCRSTRSGSFLGRLGLFHG